MNFFLLLGDKEGVKEVRCDSVSIYGARSHGTEACEEKKKKRGFLLKIKLKVL